MPAECQIDSTAPKLLKHSTATSDGIEIARNQMTATGLESTKRATRATVLILPTGASSDHPAQSGFKRRSKRE